MTVETAEELKEPLKCQRCGHVGEDVEAHNYYIGGWGDTHRNYCADSEACEKRCQERWHKRFDKVS